MKRLKISPNSRADETVRRLLRAYWRDFCRHEGAVRRGRAGEPLHDYRVAARRSRALLTQMADLFPERTVRCYRRELAWLGSRTGPVRDLELFEESIRAFAGGRGPEVQSALEPVYALLDHRAELAEAHLLRALESRRYQLLKEGWLHFLQRPAARRPRSSLAARPVIEIAGGKIHRVLRKIARKARHLDGKISDKRLHRLRIRLKTLRYLAESFASLYEPGAVEGLISVTKKLQTLLGDFQDLVVHRGMLGELAGEALPDESIKAIASMDRALEKRQRKVRKEAAKHYRKLCAPKNLRHLDALFG